MADETSTPQAQGGRPGGNREPGGFRIRLSDNEMRAARSVQEAFRLRSTVAVLGFCVRTVGQLLEEGKLDELVQEMRNQPAGRDGGRPARRAAGEGRPPRQERAPRIDPFARPSRPKPAPAAADASPSADETVTSDEPVASNDETVTEETSAAETAAAETVAAETSTRVEPSPQEA